MSGTGAVLVVGGSDGVAAVLEALGLRPVWDDGAVALWAAPGTGVTRLEAVGQLSLPTGTPSGAGPEEGRE